MPDLLGYKVAQGLGEIMMADAGKPLTYWKQRIDNKDNRMSFICEMIPQITNALHKLHGFGYSHGDLKPENICCRVTSWKKFKFTLIDFGVSSKLPFPGQFTKKKMYRGNLKFSTAEQIANRRANRIDDLFSLLYVAYDFAVD